MMNRRTALCVILFANLASAAEPSAAERGKTLLTTKAFIPAFWPRPAYDAAWKTWGVKDKPANYDTAFQERYGLAKAPYANDGLPMGLRLAPYLPIAKGIGIDCLTCHGGSLRGESVIGLGNSSLDIQGLFEDLPASVDVKVKLPFTFGHVRGTSEAGAFSVYLLGSRNDDLTLRDSYRDLGLHDNAVEDVPAWWLLKKKRTMYYVGATDSRSVRSIMQFMMHPLATAKDFAKAEPDFEDIQQYLLSLEAPKYPYAVDRELAKKGEGIFNGSCAKCHGSYGDSPSYPNKIIPLREIGTDRKRFENINAKFSEAYNASWFAKKPNGTVRETAGYQAPPLDGIWATAPYFHNASVPTLAGVLNSKARPMVFTRSYRTNDEDYDRENVGWKVSVPEDAKRSPFEQRKIYDTTKPGRGNGGHTYGDDLSDADRKAVIEYLKTL